MKPEKLLPFIFLTLFVLIVVGVQQIVFLATVAGISIAILWIWCKLPSLDSIYKWFDGMEERRLVQNRLYQIKWTQNYERHKALKARIEAQYPLPEEGGEVMPTGNTAFDKYRKDVLDKLHDEELEFKAFIEKLKLAKDQAEFDQFMAHTNPFRPKA